MDYEVRPFREADRPAVVGLFAAFQDFLVALDPVGRLRRESDVGERALKKTLDEVAKGSGTFLVAVDGERIVGFVAAILLEPIREPGVAPAERGRITELFVDASGRRKGVGRLLLESAERYLKDAGCEFVKVEVFAPNRDARAFYQTLGFVDYDIDMIKRVR